MTVNILSLVLSPIDWLGPFVVNWYWKFQVISLALLVGTIIFGFLTIIAGKEANKQQARQIIDSRRKLEAERITRLEMEESIAPRTIVSTNKSIDVLKSFEGTPVVIQYVSDAEAKRLAEFIAFPLGMAGWHILTIERTEEHGIPDGVTLDTRLPTSASPSPPGATTSLSLPGVMSAEDKMRARSAPPVPAAQAFTEFLEANDLKAATASWENAWGIQKIPLGAIRIWVGFKPTPYFDEKLRAGDDPRLTKLLELHKEEDRERVEELRKKWFIPPRARDLSAYLPVERSEARHISEEQRLKILAFIKDHSEGVNRLPTEISCPSGNTEACAFADEIVDVLRQAKWPIQGDGAIRDKDFRLKTKGVVVKEPTDVGTAAERMPSVIVFDALRSGEMEIDLIHGFDSSKYGLVRVLVAW